MFVCICVYESLSLFVRLRDKVTSVEIMLMRVGK